VHISGSRPLSLLLVVATLGLAGAVPARAQTGAACFDDAEETPEGYGPTDISAVSGNGGMSVAVNHEATVTVLKWPTPSYYDQIKYRTTDRSKPRFGALPNEGAFLGIAHRTGATRPWQFSWLRTWSASQRFADDDTDAIVTTFRKRSVGLTVKLTDVVNAEIDALYRNVKVSRTPASKVRAVRVISFANFNPVFSKTAQSPTDDWCTEEDNDDGGTYVQEDDAITHERSGTDASTGDASSVVTAMGFIGKSNGHQVGPDTYAGNGDEGSAYDDAGDGKLEGNDSSTGQTDAALADDIFLTERTTGSTTVVIVATETHDLALEMLGEARFRSASATINQKARWWRAWLRTAKLPRNAPASVTRLAKRSLITIRQATDRDTSMIVASVSTQPPYGVDWIREGAYINHALDLAGHPGTVAAHNIRYGELQATATSPPIGGSPVPPGNWAQNYYTDGVVGGPIPYEIDETGYGIWTLWDHYTHTQNRDYLFLAPVYEAIQRAAHYLTENAPLGCKDVTNNLQCSANEGDRETPSQTLVGAQAVWLGLDSAVQAARVRNTAESLENADTWSTRRDELGVAIEANFFDPQCKCYTRDYEVGGAFLWPVGYEDYGSSRSDAQADVNFRHMTRVFGRQEGRGRYESKMLLGNAYAWAGTSEISKVKRGLAWVATKPTTDSTGLLGEAWMYFPKRENKLTTMQGQPHAPSHAMFYLAALKAYGSKPYSFD
jgi:GH15 family glucan-1,4-alpha-glucosidase